MPFPSDAGRLEIQRGRTTTLTYWPRIGEELVTVTSPVITVYDMNGVVVSGLVATQQADKSITASWTPANTLLLAADYRFEVSFSYGGATRQDVTYFDLVRVPLTCPITYQTLLNVEPILEGATLAPQLASTAIESAWTRIRQRIYATGQRARLVTNEDVFVRPATSLALSNIFAALQRAPGDVWESKRDYYAKDWEDAWAAIGELRFEVYDVGVTGLQQPQITTPRFRI